jgi:hypothetical protein
LPDILKRKAYMSTGKRMGGDWIVRDTHTRSAFSQDWREIVSDTRRPIVTAGAYDSSRDGTVSGVQIREADAQFIALAGTVANRLDEAGYDGDAAIKALPELLAAMSDVMNEMKQQDSGKMSLALDVLQMVFEKIITKKEGRDK